MNVVLVQETSPSGRARQRFEAASQHEEGEDGAREAWEAELMQALKDEREVSHAMLGSTKLVQNCCRSSRFRSNPLARLVSMSC